MSNYETRIRTKFGEILVNFDSVEDLNKNLDALDLNAVSKTVEEKLKSVIVREPRQAKPNWHEVYRFTPQGDVELLRTPPSAPMTIGLLLYASDPDPVSSEIIFSSTGIRAGDYVSQTAYKKYFDRTPDDKLVLTHPGRLWVETEVASKVKTATPETKSG
jgi:hypothetical protein